MKVVRYGFNIACFPDKETVQRGERFLEKQKHPHTPHQDNKKNKTSKKVIHFFLQYPNDGTSYKNALGLAGLEGMDIRATAGFVIFPPSNIFIKLSYK